MVIQIVSMLSLFIQKKLFWHLVPQTLVLKCGKSELSHCWNRVWSPCPQPPFSLEKGQFIKIDTLITKREPTKLRVVRICFHTDSLSRFHLDNAAVTLFQELWRMFWFSASLFVNHVQQSLQRSVSPKRFTVSVISSTAAWACITAV